MAIFGAVGEGKIVLAAIIAFATLVALIIYLPIAIIKEVTRPKDETLPEWMGTVRGRRARFRVILAVLGLIAIGVGTLTLVNQ